MSRTDVLSPQQSFGLGSAYEQPAYPRRRPLQRTPQPASPAVHRRCLGAIVASWQENTVVSASICERFKRSSGGRALLRSKRFSGWTCQRRQEAMQLGGRTAVTAKPGLGWTQVSGRPNSTLRGEPSCFGVWLPIVRVSRPLHGAEPYALARVPSALFQGRPSRRRTPCCRCAVVTLRGSPKSSWTRDQTAGRWNSCLRRTTPRRTRSR